MKSTLFVKAALVVIVFVGFAAVTPAHAARTPRPPGGFLPPAPVSPL